MPSARCPALALAAGLGVLVGAGPVRADGELTRANLLEEALKLAMTVSPLDERAVVVAEVALTILPADRDKADGVLREAGFIATQVPTELAQALAMQAVAQRIRQIDEKWAEDVFEKAVGLANEIPFPGQVSLLLTQVALGRADSAPDTAVDLLQEAAEQARLVPEINARVAALRDVSSAYATLDESEAADALFQEALGTAGSLPEGAERDLALADLAGFIAGRSLGQAVEVAGTIVDPAARSQALRDIVLVLPAEEAPKALELASSIPDAPTEVATLRDLALAAPDIAAEAAAQATEVAGALLEDDVGHEARAAAAAAWAPTDIDRALVEAQAIPDEYYADLARSQIALFVVDKDPGRALEITNQIERSVLRAEPLNSLVAQLAKEDPKRAYELVSEILSRRPRVEALLAIARQLPQTPANGGR